MPKAITMKRIQMSQVDFLILFENLLIESITLSDIMLIRSIK